MNRAIQQLSTFVKKRNMMLAMYAFLFLYIAYAKPPTIIIKLFNFFIIRVAFVLLIAYTSYTNRNLALVLGIIYLINISNFHRIESFNINDNTYKVGCLPMGHKCNTCDNYSKTSCSGGIELTDKDKFEVYGKKEFFNIANNDVNYETRFKKLDGTLYNVDENQPECLKYALDVLN